MKVHLKTVFWVLSLYMFTFQATLESFIPVVGYWDELFIPLFLFSVCNKKIEKWMLKMFFLILTLVFEGGIFAFWHHYQPTSAVIMDAITCMKYTCTLFYVYILFKTYDFEKHSRVLCCHVKIICWLIFAMEILDSIFVIWPYTFLRWGFRARMLCFGHPGRLALVAMLILILARFLECYDHRLKVYQYGMILVMFSTLRALAVATIILYFALILYLRKHKRIDAKALMALTGVAIAGGWGQISVYYFSGNVTCRILLMQTGVKIARDYFPFGTGLGTFASAASGIIYSPIYDMYGLSGYYGISPNAYNDITDSFWGFLLGQFGVVGLILFILFMTVFWKQINKHYMGDAVCYQIMVLIFLYLCYATVSSISLFHTGVVPFAFVMGMCFARSEQVLKYGQTGISKENRYNYE